MEDSKHLQETIPPHRRAELPSEVILLSVTLFLSSPPPQPLGDMTSLLTETPSLGGINVQLRFYYQVWKNPSILLTSNHGGGR